MWLMFVNMTEQRMEMKTRHFGSSRDHWYDISLYALLVGLQYLWSTKDQRHT